MRDLIKSLGVADEQIDLRKPDNIQAGTGAQARRVLEALELDLAFEEAAGELAELGGVAGGEELVGGHGGVGRQLAPVGQGAQQERDVLRAR